MLGLFVCFGCFCYSCSWRWGRGWGVVVLGGGVCWLVFFGLGLVKYDTTSNINDKKEALVNLVSCKSEPQ